MDAVQIREAYATQEFLVSSSTVIQLMKGVMRHQPSFMCIYHLINLSSNTSPSSMCIYPLDQRSCLGSCSICITHGRARLDLRPIDLRPISVRSPSDLRPISVRSQVLISAVKPTYCTVTTVRCDLNPRYVLLYDFICIHSGTHNRQKYDQHSSPVLLLLIL